MRDDAGLAGARPGNDQGRPFRCQDRLPLLWV